VSIAQWNAAGVLCVWKMNRDPLKCPNATDARNIFV
jgi:hypothetical protein